jgi:hypothetical protein
LVGFGSKFGGAWHRAGVILPGCRRSGPWGIRVLPYYVVVLVECAAFETRGVGVRICPRCAMP